MSEGHDSTAPADDARTPDVEASDADRRARGEAVLSEPATRRLSRDGKHERLMDAGFTYNEATALLDGLPLPRSEPPGDAPEAVVPMSFLLLGCVLATLALVAAVLVSGQSPGGYFDVTTSMPLAVVSTLLAVVVLTIVGVLMLHLLGQRWEHPFAILYCVFAVLMIIVLVSGGRTGP